MLSRLDIRKEYEALGLRFRAGKPNAKGWLEVRPNKSAAVNLRTGWFRDQGGDGRSCSFWDYAAQHGGYLDWLDALRHFAERVGVALPGNRHGALASNDNCSGRPSSPLPRAPSRPSPEPAAWTPEKEQWAKQVESKWPRWVETARRLGKLDELAGELGVPVETLVRRGVAWFTESKDRPREGHWAWREYHADGRLAGIRRRFPGGSTKMAADQEQGHVWDSDAPSRSYDLNVEGLSDLLACDALRLDELDVTAIARPSKDTKTDQLASLHGSAQFAGSTSLILAERDKDSSDPRRGWPGIAGAARTARRTQDANPGRSVLVVLSPEGFKDIRDWLNRQRVDLDDRAALLELGRQLLGLLLASALTVEAAEALAAEEQRLAELARASKPVSEGPGDGLAAHESMPLMDSRRLALLAGATVLEGPPGILPCGDPMDEFYAPILIRRLLSLPPDTQAAPSPRLVQELVARAVEAAANPPVRWPLFAHDRKVERCLTPAIKHLRLKHGPLQHQATCLDCNQNSCPGCFPRKRTDDKNDAAERFVNASAEGEDIYLLTAKEFERYRSRIKRLIRKWKEGGMAGPKPLPAPNIRVLLDGGVLSYYVCGPLSGAGRRFGDVAEAILHMAAAVDGMTPFGVAPNKHRVRFNGAWRRPEKPPSKWAVIGKITHDQEGVLDILRRHRVPEAGIRAKDWMTGGQRWYVCYTIPTTWSGDQVAALYRELHATPISLRIQSGSAYRNMGRTDAVPGGPDEPPDAPDDAWAFWAPPKPPD